LEQGLVDHVADDLVAGGGGVAVVAEGEARSGAVPGAHRALAAHGLEGVEEGAAAVRRRPALRRDDARDGSEGADAALGALGLVEGRDDEAAELRSAAAHAVDDLDVLLVVAVLGDGVAGLVAAEAEDEQV